MHRTARAGDLVEEPGDVVRRRGADAAATQRIDGLSTLLEGERPLGAQALLLGWEGPAVAGSGFDDGAVVGAQLCGGADERNTQNLRLRDQQPIEGVADVGLDV